MNSLLTKLHRILATTSAKVKEEQKGESSPITEEYRSIERASTLGQPWEQHDNMVNQGLCNAAVQHEDENRYCNLFPYDSSRVELTSLASGDYINANWVSLAGVPEHKFILTMAPLHPDSKDRSNTCPQFWRMIEQEDVKTVVMLCNIEKGFTGCSQYFPSTEGETQTHGAFRLSNTQTLPQDDLTLRDFELQGLSGEKKIVKHMHFKLWPNYKVVENISQLVHLVKAVHDQHHADGPLVVHCSGGIGRSGTFTTIYTFYNMLKTALEKQDDAILKELIGPGDDLILHPLVLKLRDSRHPWMVEGEHQYLLAYQTCVQILKEHLETK